MRQLHDIYFLNVFDSIRMHSNLNDVIIVEHLQTSLGSCESCQKFS